MGKVTISGRDGKFIIANYIETWYAHTVKKTVFPPKIFIAPNETIQAVVPFGVYPPKK